jgi:hypothetical protein
MKAVGTVTVEAAWYFRARFALAVIESLPRCRCGAFATCGTPTLSGESVVFECDFHAGDLDLAELLPYRDAILAFEKSTA